MQTNFEKYLKNKTGVTDAQYKMLAPEIETKKFTRGEFLLQKGQVCRHSFFIEKGLARFYSIDDSGKEHILQFAPENWFVTDRESVYCHAASTYFIDAIEDTEAVLIDTRLTEYIAEINPLFRTYNEQILQNHIRHLQNRINLLISASAEQRYLDFIQLYPDLTLRVPQWMIASFLGITPESLSRVRKELARKHFRTS